MSTIKSDASKKESSNLHFRQSAQTEWSLSFFIVIAALLAGVSFAGLFGLKPLPPIAIRDRSRDIENALRTLYTLSMFVAWLLALVSIVVSTSALTKNLHGRYDTMAETGYLLLKTQFRFEFLVTRWGYLTSLLAFFVGVTQRVLVEFQLYKSEKTKTLGIAFLLFMGGVFLNLVSIVNSNLFCFQNWWGMTYDVIAVSLKCH